MDNLTPKEQKKTAEDSGNQKETKILEKVESFLLGLILFLGNYFRTVWHVLFRPANIPTLVSDANQAINHEKQIGPLTYLFTSLLAFLFIYSMIFLQIDKYYTQKKEIVGLFEKLVNNIVGFKTTETLYLLAPFVLFVALLAKLSSIIGRIWTIESSFQLQLYLYSYIFGTAFFIIGSLSGIGLVFGVQIIQDNLTSWQTIFVFITIIIASVSLIILVFRYFTLLRDSLSVSWGTTFLIVAILLIIITTIGYIMLHIFDL